jgi:hypothetical protein
MESREWERRRLGLVDEGFKREGVCVLDVLGIECIGAEGIAAFG